MGFRVRRCAGCGLDYMTLDQDEDDIKMCTACVEKEQVSKGKRQILDALIMEAPTTTTESPRKRIKKIPGEFLNEAYKTDPYLLRTQGIMQMMKISMILNTLKLLKNDASRREGLRHVLEFYGIEGKDMSVIQNYLDGDDARSSSHSESEDTINISKLLDNEMAGESSFIHSIFDVGTAEAERKRGGPGGEGPSTAAEDSGSLDASPEKTDMSSKMQGLENAIEDLEQKIAVRDDTSYTDGILDDVKKDIMRGERDELTILYEKIDEPLRDATSRLMDCIWKGDARGRTSIYEGLAEDSGLSMSMGEIVSCFTKVVSRVCGEI